MLPASHTSSASRRNRLGFRSIPKRRPGRRVRCSRGRGGRKLRQTWAERETGHSAMEGRARGGTKHSRYRLIRAIDATRLGAFRSPGVRCPRPREPGSQRWTGRDCATLPPAGEKQLQPQWIPLPAELSRGNAAQPCEIMGLVLPHSSPVGEEAAGRSPGGIWVAGAVICLGCRVVVVGVD